MLPRNAVGGGGGCARPDMARCRISGAPQGSARRAPLWCICGVPGRAPWTQRPRSLGTCRPSPYGLDVAGGLGEGLGEAGVVVISGLARGIDRAAHSGALRRGGKTVAVMGCGVDIVYLGEHRTLTVL
jgi:hypothetical protein